MENMHQVNSDNQRKNQLFIGLDVGTDSVGYAVTDGDYNLLKKHGDPMWGSHVFEAGKTKEERRGFRTARRRLDRRQQRITLLQMVFAHEVEKVDKDFFIRLKESGLRREDTSTGSSYTIFDDRLMNDSTYQSAYPTIHHLIQDLYESTDQHDVRLLYLACAWFMAHRGHFLNEVDKEHIDQLLDFHHVYKEFCDYYRDNYDLPLWECDEQSFRSVMSQKLSVTRKEAAFNEILNGGKKLKPDKKEDGAAINRAALIKLLAGGTLKTDKLFLQIDPVSLTGVLLEKLIQEKVKVIFCDSKRNPQSELVPYYGSHDCSRKLKTQLEWSGQVKGEIWTAIVAEKIRKQADFLMEVEHESEAQLLYHYLTELRFADESNREGHSAKVYFNALFGKDFTRSDNTPVNAALNYGYSLILSSINREVAANGYLTQLGLFHDNIYNQFNLSCDLMEPFRIIVDRFVCKNRYDEFGTEEKHDVLRILETEVGIDNTRQILNNAIRIYVKSVFDALNERDTSLILFYTI